METRPALKVKASRLREFEEEKIPEYIFWMSGYRQGWKDGGDAVYQVGQEFHSLGIRLKQWAQRPQFWVEHRDQAIREAGRMMAEQARRTRF